MKMVELENSVRLLLVPCEAQSVAAGVFVGSGSRHEKPSEAGISHFIEHMLFKGTAKRKAVDITRAIEGRGGAFNAFTSEEATCYYIHIPDEYLSEAVDILGDMYRHAAMRMEDFRLEKQVILEEIKMYADDPASVAAENMQRALFPENPLGASVAGSAESLLPMTSALLKRYMKSHYLGANTIVAIVGSFDEREAASLVRRAFGRKTALSGSAAPEARKVDFSSRVTASVSVDKDIAQTQLALGYRTFGMRDPRRYAGTVLAAVLGRGMSSRLFQEVREKRGLSYDISAQLQFFSDAGIFSVTAGLDGSKAEKALATIDRELGKVCRKRIPAAELARTKEFLAGNFRLSQEKTVSKLFYYGASCLAYGRPVPPQDEVAAIRAVTADDIIETARDIFREENRTVSWVVPREDAGKPERKDVREELS